MSDNDSKDEIPQDRTVIMPTPGRRRDTAEMPASPPAGVSAGYASPAAEDSAAIVRDASKAYHNPILSAAAPLLAAIARLRETPVHDDPPGLRQSLAQAVRQFEAQAQQSGVPQDRIIAARYLLCTLIDEAAADTPWGGGGVWASHSLLVLFNNEAWGGEKCFQLLGKLAENPSANRDLLELFHVCLALGFQGRYRAIEGGAGQLASVRERLWQMISREAGARDPELSPHWKSDVSGRELKWHIPAWVIAGAAALAIGLLYIGLVLMLNATSDPVFAAIQNLKLKTAALPPEPPPPPAAPPPPRLSGFLAPEIKADLVAVADLPDRSVVTIRGDGLFSAGSAEVDAKGLPILDRIADALKSTPGSVVVAGHSDSQPIRSARFPSNWHLSLARAKAVQAYLAQTVPAQRLKAEGKSDSEPVAGNDTPEGRAKNRRVAITLFPESGSDAATVAGSAK